MDQERFPWGPLNSALGTSSVAGRNRVASPPARMATGQSANALSFTCAVTESESLCLQAQIGNALPPVLSRASHDGGELYLRRRT